MKKILAVLSIVLTMFISSESLARHHNHFHCGTCGMSYVGTKHWESKYGWWLPVGMITGAIIASSYQKRVYQGYHPVVVQQPVYYVPSNQQYIIIRDTNYPNRVIYQYY